jgi:hypothetical protein
MADQFDDQIEKLRQAREEAELFTKIQKKGWDATSMSITGALKNMVNIRREEKTLADLRKKAAKTEQEIADFKAQILATGKQLSDQQKEELKKAELMAQYNKDYADKHEKTLASMKSQLSIGTAIKNTVWAGMLTISTKILEQVASIPGFLNDADKALRKMTLSLGASGGHADRIRDSTLAAGQYAAQFGIDVGKLAGMQQTYTDLTGKANTMSAESLKSVTAMAAGTSLGAEGAAQMAASFERIGMSAGSVAELTEQMVNDSDALGINSASVLKNISANVKKSNEFTFKNGAAGLKNMAIQAEKIKISIEDTFAASEKARTLEGSLDMAAQLMVLGGNFSKADPFQLSFLARNDPEKFQKALGDMTKGVASFNRETGTFSISAYDMDRLRQASEATGVSMDSLTHSATEFAKMNKAKSNIFVGSDEDKEYIARMAEMGKDGTFKIDVGGTAVELSKLTGEQVGLLKTQKSTLEARAKDAQSFDEVFGNFLLELKSTALPLMKYLTSLLGGVKSAMDGMRGFGLKYIAFGLALLAGGTMLFKGLSLAKGLVGGIGGMLSKGGTGAASAVASGAGEAASGAAGPAASAGGFLSKIGGSMGTAATIAAIGVAAVGLGYGFKLAAEGAASLATAMKGMTGGEMAGLLGVVLGLGAAFVGFGFAMSAALTSVGANPMAWAGVAVVAALGVAAVAAGYGVNLATKGIGDMVGSFASLGSVDYSSLTNLMGVIGNTMSGDMGNFGKIKEMVQFLKETQTSMASELTKMMNRPIKLELAGDSMMTCNIEVHNNIDGDKMVSKFTKKFQVAVTDATKGLRNL